MAVFAISSSGLSHSPGTAPVQTGGGAGHAQERKHKVDHRVLSTNQSPLSFHTIRTTRTRARDEPRRYEITRTD